MSNENLEQNNENNGGVENAIEAIKAAGENLKKESESSLNLDGLPQSLAKVFREDLIAKYNEVMDDDQINLKIDAFRHGYNNYLNDEQRKLIESGFQQLDVDKIQNRR